jgi:hypothetical protein
MGRASLVGFVAFLLAAPAFASESLSDVNAHDVTLAVNARGEALVSYMRADGNPRHVLVWGGINALPPDQGIPQVAFHWDYAGGWGKYRNSSYWRSFHGACGAYDGPPLAYLVAACKAPDGSYWAVQSWQRKLPHRGFPPWNAAQTAWRLDVSHWTGDLAQIELYSDWAFGGEAQGIFGRYLYAGQPVYGFGTTKAGVPTDHYGRGLYIDTLDSAYGPGWSRETSIVSRNPTGSFCYSFWPTNDATLPGSPRRPAGAGTRYRVSAMGPGVTPDVAAEVDGVGDYDPHDPADVQLEDQQLHLFDQVTAGDKFCPTQR